MRKLLLVIVVFTIYSEYDIAQSPAQFSYNVKEKEALHYTVAITIGICNQWHIYMQDASPPVLPIKISFAKNLLLEINNKPTEKGSMSINQDSVLDAKAKYYNNKVAWFRTSC